MSLHVYPTNYLFEHDTDTTHCWCDPEIRWEDPETGEKFLEPLVIHNAADGRELTE